MEANDIQGLTNLDPRYMVGMIYVGDHPTQLYILSIQAVGLKVIEKMILKKNPVISLCKLSIPRGVTSLHPRGLIGRIYVGYH